MRRRNIGTPECDSFEIGSLGHGINATFFYVIFHFEPIHILCLRFHFLHDGVQRLKRAGRGPTFVIRGSQVFGGLLYVFRGLL